MMHYGRPTEVIHMAQAPTAAGRERRIVGIKI